MLKVERNRARRTRKRERRRIFFYNARQVAAEKNKEIHAAMKAEEKISKSDANLVETPADRKAMGLGDAGFRRNPGTNNHQTAAVCSVRIPNSRTGYQSPLKMKEHQGKINHQITTKIVPNTQRGSPQKTPSKMRIESEKNEKKSSLLHGVKLPNNKVQISPYKKFELSNVSSSVINGRKPQENKPLKALSPTVNRNKTQEIISKSDITKIEPISNKSKTIKTTNITNDKTMEKPQTSKIKLVSRSPEGVRRQIPDDCTHSTDQIKLNAGRDSNVIKKEPNLESDDGTKQIVINSNVVSERKYTEREKTDTSQKEPTGQNRSHKCEAVESSSTLPADQKKEIQSGNTGLNLHNEYQKSKSESEAALDSSTLPKVPKCAVYVEDLEKQSGTGAHVIKSDQDVLSPITNKGKKAVTVSVSTGVLQSAGDGMELHRVPGERRDDKTEILLPWQKRSSRWSHLFLELIALPDNRKEKAGALNFCFGAENLLIAKGYVFQLQSTLKKPKQFCT